MINRPLMGARLGVQFARSSVALKAFPVLLIGGFDSIGSVIIAGLLVGAAEKVSEVYLGPIIGGGLENFIPYVLAMVILVFRPYGLFGKVQIDRV